MFERLIESRPTHQWSVPQTLAAITVHLVIIAIGVHLTRAAATPAPALRDAAPLFYRPPTRSPETGAPTRSPNGASPATTPVAPMSLPTPSVDIAVPVFSSDTGMAPVRTVPKGIEPVGPPHGMLPTPDGINDAGTVDEPARYVSGPQPVYPPVLRDMRITGTVTLRYIVEVDGTVARNTVAVLSSTNRAFEAPAIEAIVRATFVPARRRGVAVRQLVEQAVRFSVTTEVGH